MIGNTSFAKETVPLQFGACVKGVFSLVQEVARKTEQRVIKSNRVIFVEINDKT
jgi:hypothetical protein